jgi:hypothetical protein
VDCGTAHYCVVVRDTEVKIRAEIWNTDVNPMEMAAEHGHHEHKEHKVHKGE